MARCRIYRYGVRYPECDSSRMPKDSKYQVR